MPVLYKYSIYFEETETMFVMRKMFSEIIRKVGNRDKKKNFLSFLFSFFLFSFHGNILKYFYYLIIYFIPILFIGNILYY